MTAQQPDLRARDVAIAKLLGWRVVRVDAQWYHILYPDGTMFTGGRSEGECWNHIKRYSTDPGECARLLVFVQGKGWPHLEQKRIDDRGYRVWLYKDLDSNGVPSDSFQDDIVLAWCAAVSEACLKALQVGEDDRDSAADEVQESLNAEVYRGVD